MTLGERMGKLEERVNSGFKNMGGLFEDHLNSHAHRERFHEKLIIALIGITGSAIVGVLLMMVKYVLN